MSCGHDSVILYLATLFFFLNFHRNVNHIPKSLYSINGSRKPPLLRQSVPAPQKVSVGVHCLAMGLDLFCALKVARVYRRIVLAISDLITMIFECMKC